MSCDTCRWMQMPTEARDVGSLGSGILSSCELPNMDSGNWTKVLRKSSAISLTLSTSSAPTSYVLSICCSLMAPQPWQHGLGMGCPIYGWALRFLLSALLTSYVPLCMDCCPRGEKKQKQVQLKGLWPPQHGFLTMFIGSRERNAGGVKAQAGCGKGAWGISQDSGKGEPKGRMCEKPYRCILSHNPIKNVLEG